MVIVSSNFQNTKDTTATSRTVPELIQPRTQYYGLISRIVKLITHLHLMSRPRMCIVLPPRTDTSSRWDA